MADLEHGAISKYEFAVAHFAVILFAFVVYRLVGAVVHYGRIIGPRRGLPNEKLNALGAVHQIHIALQADIFQRRESPVPFLAAQQESPERDSVTSGRGRDDLQSMVPFVLDSRFIHRILVKGQQLQVAGGCKILYILFICIGRHAVYRTTARAQIDVGGMPGGQLPYPLP